MIRFNTRVANEIYAAWYLLPTIRFGLWDHRASHHSNQSGGFIAFTFLKFDACLMWTVTHNAKVRGCGDGN